MRSSLNRIWGIGLLFSLSGCAHTAGEAPLLAQLELERARTQAAEQRARLAELEARLAELEHRSGTGADTHARQVSEQLESVIALNRRLLLEIGELPHRQTPEAPAPELPETAPPASDPESPESRLQRLVAQLRSGDPAWRGGLSREKREALRLLLRAERALDPTNPLR